MKVRAAVLNAMGASMPYAKSKPLSIEEVELRGRERRGDGGAARGPATAPSPLVEKSSVSRLDVAAFTAAMNEAHEHRGPHRARRPHPPAHDLEGLAQFAFAMKASTARIWCQYDIHRSRSS